MKYVFKKIKAAKSVADTGVTQEVTVLDKKSGTIFVGTIDAQVNYTFEKPVEVWYSGHAISLKVDDQFFASDDLGDFISFLQAAKQRLEKQDAKAAVK